MRLIDCFREMFREVPYGAIIVSTILGKNDFHCTKCYRSTICLQYAYLSNVYTYVQTCKPSKCTKPCKLNPKTSCIVFLRRIDFERDVYQL